MTKQIFFSGQYVNHKHYGWGKVVNLNKVNTGFAIYVAFKHLTVWIVPSLFHEIQQYVVKTDEGYYAGSMHGRVRYTENKEEAVVYTEKIRADEQAGTLQSFFHYKNYPNVICNWDK